ncbi:hypothetical protein [Trabulsiella odontotermitis]|uniref:hypothetical protein n=1 Tax=Trabulsiella odontotermitis TaxID=379893 RepID=UPI0006BA4E41|nr:hypothetical protein [Trabulsiella odontotermitis]
MMNLIKRFFRRMFRSLISYYGPAVLTIMFALVQGVLFPDSPIWLIPVFFVFVIVIFYRYVEW